MAIDTMIGQLDQFADELDYALVGPRDSRQRITNTTTYPHSTVVHLCRDFGDGRCRGCSGVLIGPNRVLTAAHCLWSLRERRAPGRIDVMPGRRDRRTQPFGRLRAAKAYIPRKFRARGGLLRKYLDFGLIILERPFARPNRFMPIVALPNLLLRSTLANNGLVSIAGYPGDKDEGTMWFHKERLRGFDHGLLFYSVDTCPGHSGSPIWKRTLRGRIIIGVHTTGILDARGRSHGCVPGSPMAPSGMVNSGVRITPRVLSAIEKPDQRRGDNHDMVQVL